ncbi:MAG TPA: transporter, partial [Planctomycetota bacterium]|nr:transporter [Planctomycetota bacterium]
MPIGAVDLAVLLLYLLGAVGLGLWVGRGQRDLAGYLLGGRHLPWWAVLGSIVATETSSVTFLSVPGLAYARDTGDLRFLQLPLGYVLGRLAISVLLLPGYFRGELVSAYALLRQRFGRTTQRAASLVFLAARNLGDGLRLFLAGVVLEELFGWSLAACVAVVGGATVVYAVFGGMRSIVWNDCAQLVVYVAGACAALAVILERLPGGLAQVLEYGRSTGKWQVFDTTLTLSDPYVLWAGVIGGAVLTLGTHGTDQMMVQRLLSAPSRAAASRALVASGFVVLVQFALFLFLGVALACYDDALRPGHAVANDRALVAFVVDELPRGVGLVGLLLAAVLAASMSTLSSSLNASAASVVEDWLGP